MASTRRGLRIGPAILGEVEADALEPLRRVEIARPFPVGDGEMNLVLHRGDAERLRAAPCDGAHVAVRHAVLLDDQALGGVDLRGGIGDFEVEDAGGALQPLRMLGALEDRAAVGALALEHGAGVVQAVGQHVDLGVRRRNQLAVEPDQVRALVEGHGHGIPSCMGADLAPQSPLLLRSSSPDMFWDRAMRARFPKRFKTTAKPRVGGTILS